MFQREQFRCLTGMICSYEELEHLSFNALQGEM